MRNWIDLVEHTCKTPGAYYDISYGDNTIDTTVRLPDEIDLSGMTDEQGQKFDDLIHDSMEEIIAKMIADIDADAELHWDEARKNDKS